MFTERIRRRGLETGTNKSRMKRKVTSPNVTRSSFEMTNTQSGPLRAKAKGGRQGVEMGAVSRSKAPGGEYKNGGQEGRADTRRNTETTNP